MSSMISTHLEALRADGYAEATIARAESWLQNLESFAGHRDLTELEAKDLEQWHKELSWTPGPKGDLYSPNTINQAVGAVRRFYRYRVIEGALLANPAIKLPVPRVDVPKKTLSPAQVRRILTAPNLETPIGIRDRAILALLLETQMPRAACARVDLTHLCFDTGAVLVTGRNRGIHSLGDGLLADLERYLNESRPLLVSPGTQALALFLDKTGKRLSVDGIRHVIYRYRPK